jgi:HPt (histidine-containing phosphotransfer) domain-containing protein
MRMVILSAGVTATVRSQSAALGVFQVLDKPVPYADLIACVQHAMAARDLAPAPLPALVPQLTATRRERAIEDHFAGHASLFDEFFASCAAQLPSDVDAGDRACAQGDAPALRRVAHNLKSVLQLIGSTEGHVMARRLEQAAADGDAFATMAPAWHHLRTHVDSLLHQTGT